MHKYLKFVLVHNLYEVFNTKDVKVGIVCYNPISLQHHFYPGDETQFGPRALREIATFLDEQNQSMNSYG